MIARGGSPLPTHQSQPMWQPPPPGLFKLNFDGSADCNPSLARWRDYKGSATASISCCSSPACSVNEVKNVSLRSSIREANSLHLLFFFFHGLYSYQLNLHPILVEGDSFCGIRWPNGSSKPPWGLANIKKEVVDLAKQLDATFIHVKQSFNSLANKLEVVGWEARTLL